MRECGQSAGLPQNIAPLFPYSLRTVHLRTVSPKRNFWPAAHHERGVSSYVMSAGQASSWINLSDTKWISIAPLFYHDLFILVGSLPLLALVPEFSSRPPPNYYPLSYATHHARQEVVLSLSYPNFV